MLRKKRTKVVKKMLMLEIAMAGFVLNPKNAMIIGIATPPPPTPATFERAIIKAKTMIPPISIGYTGKTSLWSHTPSSFTPQTNMGKSAQSVSTTHAI